jgi:hypothetical protein
LQKVISRQESAFPGRIAGYAGYHIAKARAPCLRLLASSSFGAPAMARNLLGPASCARSSRLIPNLRRGSTMENVWSAARLQAESLSWVVWSAQMYPACLWRQAPGHNGVRASPVYKDSRTQEVRISRQT